MTIYECKVINFHYKEIIKNNRTIIFNNINVNAYFLIGFDDPEDFDNERTIDEVKSFQIDKISIDNNKRISYGNAFDDNEYGLQALQVIINKTITTIETKSNN